MKELLLAHLKSLGADKLPDKAVASLLASLEADFAEMLRRKVTPKTISEHLLKALDLGPKTPAKAPAPGTGGAR